MSYASANGAHETAAAAVHIDPAHPDIIHLSDAELLFRGTLHRAGADLHLSHGDAHAIIAGYFASDHPAALVGPNGGRLTSDVVALLAGPQAPAQYAQAQVESTASDAAALAQHEAIGRVEKVVGDVTVVRNGVAVELHIGDAVYKGDIIQTGTASAAGIAFPDGTALNLVPDTRMTLNAYSYGAHAGANAALFTLVDGTFAFVAGKVAQSGDMKIATPVATMAVHGATGWAHELTPSEIATVSAKLGSVTYSFAVVDDHGADTHGIYDLLVDGSVVGSINDPNLVWYFDKAGNLISMPLNDSERSFADGLFSDFYDWQSDVVTQSLGVRGSGGPIDQPTFPDPVNLDSNMPPFDFSFLSGGSNGLFVLSPLPPFLLTHTPSDIFIWNGFGNWDQQVSDWNQGFAPTVAADIVIIQSGKSSYDNAYTIGSLTVDFGAILNIVGGSLTTPAINNAGLIQINSSGSDPALVIEGAFDLTGGGAIHMLGPASENFIIGLAGSGATLTNIDNTIAGSGNIGASDRNLTFVNEATIDATPLLSGDSGLLTVHTGNLVDNLGVFEATFGGELVVDDRLLNSNLVEAIGAGSSVVIDNGSAGTGRVLSPDADINSGTIEAVLGGTVELLDDGIDNEHGGLIGATGIGAQVELAQSLIQNDGEIAAAQAGLVAFDRDRIKNESDGLIEATGRHSEVDIEHSRITNRGTIEARDRGSQVFFVRDHIDNSGLIEAAHRGEVGFYESHVDNDYFGIIESDGRHSEILFARDHVDNSGLIEAAQRGKIGLFASHVHNDYFGAIEAKGADSEIDFGFDHVGNRGIIAARWGGEVGFFASHVHNGYFGAIESVGKGSQVAFEFDFVGNRGLIGASLNGSLSIDDSWVHNATSGEIRADGRGAQVAFDDDGIENAGLIAAISGGEIGFGGSDIDNDKPGLIEARGGAADIAFSDDRIDNSGRIAAARGGAVDFYDSFVGNDEDARIEAKGRGSQVAFGAGTVDNSGLIEARHHGQVWFADTLIDNARNGTIEAGGRGSEIDVWLGSVDNRGRIEARHGGTVELFATTVDNRSGVIAAIGRGAAIELAQSEVDGGLMRTARGGLIETVEDSGQSALGGVTIESGSHVDLANGTTLLLSDGTTMLGGTLKIGEAGGGSAAVDIEDHSGVTLDGVDVTAYARNDGIDVGLTHDAKLVLDDGTTIAGGTLALGTASHVGHHIGTVDVESPAGATLDDVAVVAAAAVDTIEVGQSSTATLTLTDDTIMTGGTLTLGVVKHHHSFTGTADVEGGSATLDGVSVLAAALADGIEVAQGQKATLLLDGGTTLTGGTLKIGAAGSVGTVDVEGASAVILNDVAIAAHSVRDAIEIGESGPATLTLDGGTTMTGGKLTIDADGTLQVDPSLAILAGVDVINHGDIVVDPGVTTLTLEDGTTITGGNLHVGPDGALDIDNSTLTNVDISDAGVVDIGSGDTFSPSDTLTFAGGRLNVVGNSDLDLTLAGLTKGDVIDLQNLVVKTAVWDGATLSLNGQQVAFTVLGGLPAGDTFAFTPDGSVGTELKILPQLVSLSATPVAGPEKSAIALGFTEAVAGGATLKSFVISGIPVGATLSDGHGRSFTATANATSFDVHNWHLGSLTITPVTLADFTLSATVTASDSSGFSYSAAASEQVHVTVPPGPPVFASPSTASVDEGVAAGSVVYTAAASDPTNAPIAYSLSGADASHFSIDANGVVTIRTVPSFETQDSYHFNVVANEAGFTGHEAVTLSVIDLPPAFTSGTAAAVNEGTSTSTPVYTAIAAEPGGGTLTYSLSGKDAAAFNLNANTGALTFKTVPSYDIQHSYDVVIQAHETNGGTLSADQDVTITVNAVAPSFSSSASASVNEGTAAGTTVYTAAATEPGGGALTYSPVSGRQDDAAAFSINAQTGAVTLDAVPSFEAKSVYHFTVEATEQSGLSTTEAVTLDVNDLPPVFSSPVSGTVRDGTAANSLVYTAAAAEPGGGTLTYSLVASGDAAYLSINAQTGAVTIDDAANLAAKGVYQFTVQASEANGGLSATEAVTLNVVPIISLSAGETVHFSGGGAPIALDSALTLTDIENNTAHASATVSIGNGLSPGDTLAFNNGTNTETFSDGATIQGVYDSATGVLTLSEAADSAATASVSDFEKALQSVTYTSGLYDPTNNGTDPSRTIHWSFNDGIVGSSVASSTVTTSHTAPIVTAANGSLLNGATFLPGGSPVILDSGIVVTDNNAVGATLLNAQVELLGAQSGDRLSFNNGTDTETFADGATIHGIYQNGTLTLTQAVGSTVTPSVVDFQTALRTVAYNSTNVDPTIGGTDLNREVYWIVHDGNSANGTNFIPSNSPDLPVDNHQPTLGLNQLVVEQGVYPSHGDGTAGDPGGIPLGAVRTFAGGFAWHDTASAQGQLLSLSANTALFSLLGTNFGGNGESNFELPSLAGKVAVGLSGNVSIGQAFGTDGVTVTQANLPAQWGGANVPLDNDQPSLSVNFLINTGGSNTASATGVASTDVAGDVIQFLGNFVPSGYLAAAGQTLNISDYRALYAAIGTTYGGDGVTTFKLPNLAGATIEGAGTSFNGMGTVALGAVTGSDTATLTTTNLPFPQGSSVPLSNQQPTVALNYIININGFFPSGNSGSPQPGQAYIGEIMAFAGTADKIPTGWMLAEGQTLPIDQYQALFSLLGTTYGGNGTTNFQLPDLVGRAVEGIGPENFGYGPTENLGERSGSNTITLTGQNLGFPTVDTTSLGIFPPSRIDTWTNGAGDGNWSTAGNWSEGISPTAYFVALVGSTGSTTINGSVTLDGGVLQIDGNVAIAAGATFAIDNTVALSEGQGASIAFKGATGELELGSPASFTAAVHGFTGTAADTAHSDAIDLLGLNFTSAHFAETYNPASGLLTVTDGTNSTSFALANFSGALDLASDGHGGTLITAQQAGSIAVAAGSVVDLAGPSSGKVTFAGGTGELKIDNAADFSGHIDGFAGTAPDARHSDMIDLAGLDYHSAQFVESYNSSTGALSVSDGTHSASFTFDNFGAALDFSSDGNGGTSISTQAITPTISVAAGSTVDFAAASSATVTFAGGTGEFRIENPGNFNGHINGFTGTHPDLSHSDAIDLVGIAHNSSFQETYDSNAGVLSVTDGAHSASFTFDNFTGTLDFVSDGNGGTLITDPPANSGAAGAARGGGDSFKFNFAAGGGGESWIGSDGPHEGTGPAHEALISVVPQEAHADWLADSARHDLFMPTGVTVQQLQAHLQSALHLH